MKLGKVIGLGLAFIALALPQAARAQLFIMVRNDKVGVAYSVDEFDGRAKLEDRVAKIGGDWSLRTASEKCGYSAVWVVARNQGGPPVPVRYFVKDGFFTPAEAMKAAQEEAYAFKGDDPKLGASSEGGIQHNHNKYSMQRLEMERLMGSRTRCSDGPTRSNGLRGT